MEDPVRQGPMFNPVVGVGYILFLWLINIFGTVFMLTPALPLLLVKPAWFRRYEEICFAVGLGFSSFVIEMVWGVKFVASGDPLRDERTLSIMNHRTNFDWLFYWDFMGLYSDTRRLKIMLKAVLRSVPGFGWIAQLSLYTFLRRKFEDDRIILYRMLRLYATMPGYQYHCLLFPEGTVLSANTKASSDRWAEKFNLQRYEYVIHPRTTGLVYCLRTLRSFQGLDAVYDVTMAYLEGPVVNKLGLFRGQPPSEVHFHVRRIPIASVPEGDAAIEKWCQGLWTEKEAMLAAFHKDRKFPGALVPQNPRYPLFSVLASLYWFIFVPACIYLVYTSAPVRWFFFIMTVAYTAVTKVWGLESLELTANGIPFPPKEQP